jgi:HK97 family phage major capsid protein
MQSFTTRNVTFTPTELGTGFQLTRAEAVRAFFNVAERMVRKLGYALAEKKDTAALTEIYAGATTSLIANSVAATTALASTDGLNIRDMSRMMQKVRTLYYRNGGGSAFIINPIQEHQLRTQNTIITLSDASQFGNRSVMESGAVGTVWGVPVYVSDLITATSSVAKAVFMGTSKTGEKPVGYAIKRDPMIEKEYHARGRYWDIVAHEEYDFATLHPDAVCLLSTYSA